jgi:hypothetical protein
MPPQASKDFYATIQRHQLLLVLGGRRLWRRMTPDFDLSWPRVWPSLVALTSGAQLATATEATRYVPAVLAETNQPDEPDGRVRPSRFAGVAADGRSLKGLMDGAVARSKDASGRGAAPDVALDFGERWLEMALQTAVTDAARQASQVATITRNLGFVRQVNPPCCPRCAVLAGKWYRSNDILPRHPGCDCLLIPASESIAGDLTTDVRKLYESGGVRDLSKAQRDAIDGGENVIKVFNQSRDRWREQMAVLRDKAKRDARRQVSPEDFMSSLVSQVQAKQGLRAAGFIGD